ncbi:hypothetical protein IEO21_07491 [Rhodonia placenta]|uniref:CMP/dCMP-type deaminase domain-containing protein n=1 Tax=Rhodonia placenta TaxID=104341 RepID=A0A8H7U047_9APHY|nr:hypothetical protein IEO21_07491 [Postia placenta]
MEDTLSDTDRRRLVAAAFDARENAYSSPGHPPFRVGAALLTADLEIVSGASVDCVSSGCVCAERTAIVKAVSEGIRTFRAIAIVSDVAVPISPCGLCRQVLYEFCPSHMPCLFVPGDYDARRDQGDASGGVEVRSLGNLIPHM